jgi:hypothetical protein
LRLIGSAAEIEIRESLQSVNASFRDRSEFGSAFFETLERARVEIGGCYLLDWLPEQGEDLYWILSPNREILELEVPRRGPVSEALISRISLHEYRQKAPMRLKLAIKIALNLIDSDELSARR